MAKYEPMVSVVILNWNGGAEDCLSAIASVRKQDYQNLEIIFVDNGSSDGSFEAVQELSPDLRFVQTGENLGCPEGRNRGAEVANGELIMFLENDGEWPSEKIIRDLVRLFGQYADLGAIYSAVEGYSSGVSDPPLDEVDTRETGIRLSSSFRGGASAIRRNLFSELGGFPGDFFRQGEERYLALKLYSAGFKVAYWPEHRMRHKGSDYPGKSAQVRRYTFQNELKTIMRLYPIPLVLLFLMLKSGVNFLRFTRSREVGAYFRSICDALMASVRAPHEKRVSWSTFWLVQAIRYENARYGGSLGLPVTDLRRRAHLLDLLFSRLKSYVDFRKS